MTQGHNTSTRTRNLDGIPFRKFVAIRHGTEILAPDHAHLRGDDLLVCLSRNLIERHCPSRLRRRRAVPP